MSKSVFSYIFSFAILTLLQISVFNRISVFGYATPFLFIYFIIKLPATMSPNWVMTLSFVMGLIIDIFSNTPGMYALAATTIAFMRRSFISLVMQREDELVSLAPSVYSFGMGSFYVYAFNMILLFCIVVFLVEAFTFFNILSLILHILCSTVLTFILVFALESLNHRKR